MMKKIISICLVLFSFGAFAQQEPLFTQYYLNDVVLNPAISGSKSYNPFIIQTRQQWLGFEGAPLSTYVSYHGALNNRSAIGGYILFDKAYPSMQGSLNLNYAYHIPLDYDKVNLSFGLGAKVMYHNLDFNKGELPPGEDNAFSTRSYDKVLGDASSGIYLYGRNFYAGLSASNLFQSSFNTTVSSSPHPNSEFRNYYTMGGYSFDIINKDWQLEPSFLLRKMEGFSAVTDLTCRILYLENSWSGLGYRTDGTAVFSFGFGSGNMHISYSYDHTILDNIQQYTYGTHEISISYRIETMATKRHISFWGY